MNYVSRVESMKVMVQHIANTVKSGILSFKASYINSWICHLYETRLSSAVR